MSSKTNRSARTWAARSGFGVMRLAAFVNVASLLAIIGLIIVEALPGLSWEFLTEPPKNMMTEGGIWPCLLGTFLLAMGSLVINSTTSLHLSMSCTSTPTRRARG